MTIAAAYLTSEGVVLGTDSTATISSQDGKVSQILNYTQKLFEVGENSRFAICTWGAGQIGDVSHRTLIARLGDKVDLNKTPVNEAVQMFIDIVLHEYGDWGKAETVGYCLGGWNIENRLPECYAIVFKPKEKPEIQPLKIGQAQFFGCPEFFTRVFHGYAPRLQVLLLNKFKTIWGAKESEKDFEKVFLKAFQEAVSPLAAIGFRDLPIREAIDFVHTYLHITIKAFKFMSGAPICGGPIEIAFISTDRRFRWVCHKSFERAIYEQDF